MVHDRESQPSNYFESKKRPSNITLCKKIFPTGTIGHTYFPSTLEGRVRPSTILDQPIQVLVQNDKSGIRDLLEKRGIHTMREVLQLKTGDSTTENLGVQNFVQGYLNDLGITRHARLLGQTAPIPSEREQELVTAVEKAIDRLESYKWVKRGTQGEVISLLYGLTDGILRSPAEVSDILGINARQLSYYRKKGLDTLRTDRSLEDYKVLPVRSFGRDLGYSFQKDIPKGLQEYSLGNIAAGFINPDSSVKTSTLSESVQDELQQSVQGSLITIHKLIELNLDQHQFSPQTQSELSHHIKRVINAIEKGDSNTLDEYRSYQRAIRRITQHQAFNEPLTFQNPREEEMTAKNRLGEIIAKNEANTELGSIPVERFGVDKEQVDKLSRLGIITIKDFLAYINREIGSIHGMTLMGANAFGARIDEILDPYGEYSYRRSDLGALINTILSPKELAYEEDRKLEQTEEIGQRKKPDLSIYYEGLERDRLVRDSVEIQELRSMVAPAIDLGLTSSEEIQGWIVEQHIERSQGKSREEADKSRHFHNINIRSWMLRALIEYILTHPKQENT